MTRGGSEDRFTSVRAPKTADLVASQLRNQIIRGQLKSGTTLPPEADLMKQFEVSRPTIREAYRVLESEGLIIVRRGVQGGARIQVPSPEMAARYAGIVLQYQGATLHDLAAARLVMEPPAAGILAERHDPDDIAQLEAVFDESPIIPELESNTFVWYDPFHIKVVELAGNPAITLFAQMTNHILQVAKFEYLAKAVSDPPSIQEQADQANTAHARLIEYIRAGDADQATSLWARHLRIASDTMLASTPETLAIDLLS